MPKRGIDYCLDVFQYLKEQGIEKQVPVATLMQALELRVSFEQKIKYKYFIKMKSLGLITIVSEGIAEINWQAVDKLMI